MHITKNQAKGIAIEFLNRRSKPFEDLYPEERIMLEQQTSIPGTDDLSALDDIYSVPFELFLGSNSETVFVEVSAISGKVYGITGPANFIPWDI